MVRSTFATIMVLVFTAIFSSSTYAVAEEVAKCAEGYRLDPRLQGAAVAPDDCVPRCDARFGKKWNIGTQVCVSVCRPGYTWNEDAESCVSKCAGGQSWSTSTSSCECATGTVWEKTQALCLTPDQILKARELEVTKKVAEVKAAATKKQTTAAEVKANECPEGTMRDYHTQQCVSMCKASLGSTRGPGTWNMREHQCDCPAGTSWSSLGGGSCRPAN